jgi:hypothetical protein
LRCQERFKASWDGCPLRRWKVGFSFREGTDLGGDDDDDNSEETTGISAEHRLRRWTRDGQSKSIPSVPFVADDRLEFAEYSIA